MKKLLLGLILCFTFSAGIAQEMQFDTSKLRQDYNLMMSDLENHYVYYRKKNVDLALFKKHYEEALKKVSNNSEALLFFEFMLMEFYDSHLHLKSNNGKSYRIYSPLYAITINNKVIIADYWKDQVEKKIDIDIIGSELVAFNDTDMVTVIERFPTFCHDKNNPEIRTWIINKILAGRYHEKRVLTLKLESGEKVKFDLDAVKLRQDEGILSYRIVENVGIIRINNSMDNLFTRFAIKKAYRKLKHTDGIIIDIRNTVSGGNTGAVYPIIGHFVKKTVPFQQYEFLNGKLETDKLKPRKPFIKKPMVLVVGRWTGSVGEGLASGVRSNKTGILLGTEMHKLAGSVCSYKFSYLTYKYQMPCNDVQQLNGEPRTAVKPDILITNNNSEEDLFIKEAIRLLKK